MRTVRWGIVGTGRMAATIADEINAMRSYGTSVEAVASREMDKARAFAQRHGVNRAVDDLGALATDAAVDALYIATPHTHHLDGLLAAVAAGKAVLCEKPFTLNAAETDRVVRAADNSGSFVMEAMWSRFLPALAAVRAIVNAGILGRVHLIVGGGAFQPDRSGDHYLFDPARGGGVLLDAGVYLLSLTSMLLGTPTRIQASGRIGATGVDEQDAIVLEHANGAMALLYLSLHARRSPDLEILGDAGRLRIQAPVFRPTRLTLVDRSGAESTQDYPIEGSGYGYQIREVIDAVRAGRRDSPIMPVSESRSIMQTMDSIRRQIGLVYPGE